VCCVPILMIAGERSFSWLWKDAVEESLRSEGAKERRNAAQTGEHELILRIINCIINGLFIRVFAITSGLFFGHKNVIALRGELRKIFYRVGAVRISPLRRQSAALLIFPRAPSRKLISDGNRRTNSDEQTLARARSF